MGGTDVVEFTGDCTYKDAAVKARIQFAVDEKNGSFKAAYIAFNEVAQNRLILATLIEKAFTSAPKQATTNSNHTLPVAENLLNREFYAAKPNQKLVSDITYVWTTEGWLYVAAIMDLYGQKIIGLAIAGTLRRLQIGIKKLNYLCIFFNEVLMI